MDMVCIRYPWCLGGEYTFESAANKERHRALQAVLVHKARLWVPSAFSPNSRIQSFSTRIPDQFFYCCHRMENGEVVDQLVSLVNPSALL